MAQGRRVRRIVRRIDTWSVFRVAALFNLSVGIVFLLAGVLLWLAGSAVGAIENVEGFMQAIGLDDFRFVAGAIFRGGLLLVLLAVALATGFTVLLSVLYNLIADVVGGVEFSVLEEAGSPAAQKRVRPASVDVEAPKEPKMRDREVLVDQTA
jgi:hypothetical protein